MYQVRPDTYGGREETGGIGQYGSGLWGLSTWRTLLTLSPREMVIATLRWMGVPQAEGHVREDNNESGGVGIKKHRRSLRSRLDCDRAGC